jgi:hypothetical protein
MEKSALHFILFILRVLLWKLRGSPHLDEMRLLAQTLNVFC